MTQTGKAVALISSFGAVGGVGAYAGGLFSNKEDEPKVIQSTPLVANISNKLTDEGFLVLDTSKDGGWQEVLNAYNAEGAKKNLFSTPKENFPSIKELKEACAKIVNKEKDTTNSYTLAKQWCVKKEKMNVVIDRAKLKLLKFEGPEDLTENKHWTKKIEDLKKDTKKFKTIEEKIKKAEERAGDHIKALKEGCKNLKTDALETISDDFAENLSLAKEWCSIYK